MNLDADRIAKFCFDFYKSNIPNKIKPTKDEWTTLSSIVLINQNDELKILSMCTGSKCLAEKQLPLDGTLVHDSHAEILARRCFIRYIYNEILSTLENSNHKSDLIEIQSETKQILIKSTNKLVLFISHTPCGDASIIPKIEKRKHENDEETSFKKIKSNEKVDEMKPFNDIYRTGAKCVPNSEIQDLKEAGVNYHNVGALRTKPGRGDPTISMSCSDKIAKWLVLGIQGSLLSYLLTEPIYLDAIVISKCPFNFESIERSLIKRSELITDLPKNYKCSKPRIIQSDLVFEFSKYNSTDSNCEENSVKASHPAICWIENLLEKPLFVLVKGYLQGAVKNPKKLTNKNKLQINKKSFLDSFKKIVKSINLNPTVDETTTYEKAKTLSENHNLVLKQFYSIYKSWIKTDPEKYYKFT